MSLPAPFIETSHPPEAMVEYVLINSFNAVEAFAGKAWTFMSNVDPKVIGGLVVVVFILAWLTRPKTRI